jgi:hypothetical protein
MENAYMKIHLQPSIRYEPSSFTIRNARMFPKADTTRLIINHNAILVHPISTKLLYLLFSDAQRQREGIPFLNLISQIPATQ